MLYIITYCIEYSTNISSYFRSKCILLFWDLMVAKTFLLATSGVIWYWDGEWGNRKRDYKRNFKF